MNETILFLIEEYKETLEKLEAREKYLNDESEKSWDYEGPQVSKAELQRIRLMLNKLMLRKEREF